MSTQASTQASTSSPELDYLAAGERLRELLLPLKAKGLKEVFVATDLDAVANLGQHTPAIHVIYQGERENDTTQSGRQSAFDQSGCWCWCIAPARRKPALVCGWGGCCRPLPGGPAVTVPFGVKPHRFGRATRAGWRICPLPSRRQ